MSDWVRVPRAALQSIEAEWQKQCRRYERVGSNWHKEMPGAWEVTVTITMAEFRALACPAAQDDAQDARRYRIVRDYIGAIRGDDDKWRFILTMDPCNYPGQGSIAEYFDAAIDAIAETGRGE